MHVFQSHNPVGSRCFCIYNYIYISVLPRSTLKQQCELFLGKLRYNVLALVPDRADVVLCQNSWELSNDCLVHDEEQLLLLSANSVVEVSDQVQTLPVGCDTSFFFFTSVSLWLHSL